MGSVFGVEDQPFDGRKTALPAAIVEPMTGIEPAYSAWEADVLPLNYIGVRAETRERQPSKRLGVR